MTTPRQPPSRPAVRDALARLPMFSRLTPEQLDLVLAGTRQVQVARGGILFRTGEPCTAFYCVISGQVKLTLSGQDGGEKVLEIISAGETFGEAVMFAGRPYPVSATALLPSVLLSVPAAVVLDLVTADPTFARGMLAGMAVRLHTMINDVEAISLRSGAQRVVGFLLALAGESPAPRPVVTLPAGKAVLASRLSLSPETFSRTLRDLAVAELIEVDGRRITLLDLARLGAVLAPAD